MTCLSLWERPASRDSGRSRVRAPSRHADLIINFVGVRLRRARWPNYDHLADGKLVTSRIGEQDGATPGQADSR